MLTLLIADDEYFILERLKRILNYSELGFELIASASNGKETLRLIEDLEPDLAIVDIKMPYISGLDIAKYIYEKKLDTKIVILTSYDYFDFAVQAIRSQVFSYLLKPVNAEELKAILNKARISILEQKSKATKLQAYDQLKIEAALQQFLSSDSFDAYVQDIYKEIPDIALVRYLLFIKVSGQEGGGDTPLAVKEKLRELMPLKYLFISYSDNIFCLLLKEDSYDADLLDTLSRQLQNTLQASVNIAASPRLSDVKLLPYFYKQTLMRLYYTIFEGENTIWNLAENEHPVTEQIIIQYGIGDALMSAVKSGNKERIHSVLCDGFEKLNKFPSMQNLEILISEVIVTCGSLSRFVDTKNPYTLSFYIHELIDNKNSLNSIQEWCEQYLASFILKDGRNENEAAIASAVMNLIHEFYSDVRLDLSYIAEKVGYTPNYLSNVFKHNTGLTVIQYITQYRMRQAHKMLSKDHLPVNKVYQLVGYSNPFYFSKRFKLFYGYSPSDCK